MAKTRIRVMPRQAEQDVHVMIFREEEPTYYMLLTRNDALTLASRFLEAVAELDGSDPGQTVTLLDLKPR